MITRQDNSSTPHPVRLGPGTARSLSARTRGATAHADFPGRPGARALRAALASPADRATTSWRTSSARLTTLGCDTDAAECAAAPWICPAVATRSAAWEDTRSGGAPGGMARLAIASDRAGAIGARGRRGDKAVRG